ncbi:MAG: LCP family protein [bacterium]|nr:LCP family protein [bacterium]
MKKPSPKNLHQSLFRRLLRTIPTNKTEYHQKKVPFFLLLLTVVVSGYIVFRAISAVEQYLDHFELSDLVSIFSEDLDVDQHQRTNILILGVGGGIHDGADLTDTIMIGSLHKSSGHAGLLSLPRDIWLDIPGYKAGRINRIYEGLKPVYGSEQALSILKGGIENMSNLNIPYYIKVDFDAFKGLVDLLEGVEVEVLKNIYDTQYPKEDGSGYETFAIEAGLQTMDGTTALKFVRSRHSTSDFDRAQRQQLVISAMKRRAAELKLFRSPLKLKQIYEELAEHIETNLKVTEMISLARFARDFDTENISSAVLKDQDVIDMGSFFYTPERQYYGGAFVLIPDGDSYRDVQKFTRFLFDSPEFFQEKASVQILNATTKTGLAAEIGNRLIKFGFNVQRYDNAREKTYQTSFFIINHPEKTQATEAVLQELYPKMLKLRGEPPEPVDDNYDITIVLSYDLIPVQE